MLKTKQTSKKEKGKLKMTISKKPEEERK